MIDQLKFTKDGNIKGEHEQKVEMAIERLKAFEPKDGSGYYLAFSGGKDSQCVYHLCKLGGGKI